MAYTDRITVLCILSNILSRGCFVLIFNAHYGHEHFWQRWRMLLQRKAPIAE